MKITFLNLVSLLWKAWNYWKKTTSAALDRVRITTTGGANTFDAGTISVSYR